MSNNNKKKEYYNQTDFDEMIADVIEPAKRNRGRQQHQQHHATAHYDDEDQYQQNEYEQDSFSSSTDNDSEQYSSPQQQPRIMVDTLPTSTDSRSISDQEDEEVISLNSDDISGGSDISDMEQQRPKDDRNNDDNFTPRPLINDDESTVDMRPPAPINQSVSSYVEALNQQQMRKNRIVRFGALLILLGVIVGVVLGIVSVTNGNGDDEGSSSSELNDGGGEGYGLESGQISVKESFVGNTTTNSPSLSPVYLDEDLLSPVTTVSLGGGSPTMPPQSAFPTKNPTLSPQSALPAKDPTLAPVDVISTDAPVIVTNAPVTPDPTPEPTPSPMTYEPTFEPTSALSPQPSQKPTYTITPPPTPNPTRYPTPKPFTITSPPTPRPTPRPTNAVIPPSPSGPTLPAGGGSPSDDTFHCAKVTYTSNWNELVDFDCSAPCSGLGMNSECPSGHQCRSDEGNCL